MRNCGKYDYYGNNDPVSSKEELEFSCSVVGMVVGANVHCKPQARQGRQRLVTDLNCDY